MKAIIFDMDGVIIDSEPIHFEIEKGLLEELGGVYSGEAQNSFVGTTDYIMWSTFKEQFNLEPSIDEIINMKKEKFIENVNRIPLIKHVKEFMSSLHEKGYLIALASSNNSCAVDEVIERFGLGKYLNFAISGEDVVNSKPHPEIFLKAAKRMKVNPSDCLVIEDAKNGVEAAKSAGMKCIGFNNPNSGNQDLSQADLIIDSYEDINLDTIKSLFS